MIRLAMLGASTGLGLWGIGWGLCKLFSGAVVYGTGGMFVMLVLAAMLMPEDVLIAAGEG